MLWRMVFALPSLLRHPFCSPPLIFLTHLVVFQKKNDQSKYHNNSIWYGAIVRGDVNPISIGTQSSIGDRAVVHVAKIQGDFPTTIGDAVTVGAGALIHAATLHSRVQIGVAAQVLDGAVIESESIVAPGSVVTAGTIVPSGQLWGGTPAKMIRVLTDVERASIAATAAETTALAWRHAVENEKDYKTVLEEEEIEELESDEALPKYEPRDMADVLGQGQPGRIFRSTLSHPEAMPKQQQTKQ
jgi:gamma-carbonic anhydrase